MLKKKIITFLLVATFVLSGSVILFLWKKGVHKSNVIAVVTGKADNEKELVQPVVGSEIIEPNEKDSDYVGDHRYVAHFDYGQFKKERRRKRRPARKRHLPLHPAVNVTTQPVYDMSDKFPRYFIIGFAKTGTKALYEVLKLHSQLSGPRKEMRYFSHEQHYNSTDYLTRFPFPPINGYTIEKSPDYILTPAAAVRLKQAALKSNLNVSTDIKFIVVLRNPVVRTVSDYLEMQIWAMLHGKLKLPEFSNFVLTSDRAVNGSVSIINTSCYIYHLNQWLQLFNLNQFCFVNGDDFITDPYAEVKNLEKCLKLESYFTKNHFVFNRNKKFYCFRKRSEERTFCMNRSKGRTHPFVDEDIIKLLKEYFRPYNEKLYSLIGKTFDWESSMKY